MSLGCFLLRNLFYHWRGNTAVLLGVAVGAAVLIGALLVGDSLRGSLREQALEQLGWVDHALVGGRFIRQEVVERLNASACPLILLQGSASCKLPGTPAGRQTSHVTILGADSRFWHPLGSPMWDGDLPEAGINADLANQLAIGPGDKLELHLQKTAAVPRETLLGRRETPDVVDTLTVTVRSIMDAKDGGRFNLNPSPEAPRNVFVPLRLLQEKLGEIGRINAILAVGAQTKALQRTLGLTLTLEDWGLLLHDPASRTRDLFTKLDRNHVGKLSRNEWHRHVAESMAQSADQNHDGVLTFEEVLSFYQREHGYLSLESRHMILEPAVAEATQAAARDSGLTAAPTFVYLANSISDGAASLPYSVVAALDPALSPPLGAFSQTNLADDEILLADWNHSPIKAMPGSPITLTYFDPEVEGQLRERTTTFKLKARIPLRGVANDPNLTPEFPGITDKLDIRDWNPPFPYDNKRIQKRDEEYWNDYRTTPKAYISLRTGQRLWGSRFGKLTSIRLAPQSPVDLSAAATSFRQHMLAHLHPDQGGLVFDAVRERSLAASTGGTDFGGLFLGFSAFLIAAALLLIGLLARLNIDRRASEIGLLLASGFRLRSVRGLLLAEGALLALVGAVLGALAAVLYAWLLLELLRSWWPGSLDRSFLRVHPEESAGWSFVLGYGCAVVVSMLTIFWAVRILARTSPRALLAGEALGAGNPLSAKRAPRRALILGVTAGGGGACLLAIAWLIRDNEMQAVTFFASGALLLLGALAAVLAWMRSTRHSSVAGGGRQGLARLGMRNAARYPTRSLLTAGLLAAAVFLVIAVESFHRDAESGFLGKESGSGGFNLIGESSLPVYQDLKSSLDLPADAARTLEGVQVYPLRRRAGDDASCLNLYQPRRPRILGVSSSFIDRGGFRFQRSEAQRPEEIVNPWELLSSGDRDGTIPAIADATTARWKLNDIKLGGTTEVTNERGEVVRLRIVALLSDSIFQSELLVSEASFLQMYPGHEGYNFFLIDAPINRVSEVKTALEAALAGQGLEIATTASRLSSYMAVENTYLATFQALGGFGLLLGALGLAVVLLRTVWERRGELALLRALGFRRSALAWLVLSENSFLLGLGLAVGTGAALLAVVPHQIAGAGQVPWLRLVVLVILVLAVGLGAGAAAVVASLRSPLIPALRRE
jgi:ABC-type antimicrobial peptide transport system permease subunit